MGELIAEDFRAHAKVVLFPQEEDGIRDVEIIVRCFASVAMGISNLKSTQNINLGQVLLGAIGVVSPHVLVCESASGDALTRIAREAKAELVDRSWGEGVSFSDCQLPVLKGTERRKARHSCAKERNVLI